MTTPDLHDTDPILDSARRTFATEIDALRTLSARLDAHFVRATHMLMQCQGRVVVTGIGKSGHIARKIAATLASTGTPAFFMHAAEALHGDLGMITGQDVVIAISYSGQAQELVTVLTVLRRMGAKLIAITGNPQSELALNADLHLDAHVEHEACPLNLAPTASTTAALALGDALAVACLEAKGFSREDFARSHPGGALGRQLLTFVRDVMRQGDQLPIVSPDTLVPDALAVMSAKGMGMTIVADPQGHPVGLFTDGDLRRLIARQGDIRHLPVRAGMTPQPRSIGADALAIEAAGQMDALRISQMLVLDANGLLLGALHMHDLLAAKVI
ncbi:KpsF/GutQ family sugar-phosphate isomerase [Alcaligenes sp. SDU_A2]|uniref:KpsF/GutQ family sugar-phosphate isomerase n=1 Tax=Alcaligenes sp. SDU_A2 TaxID=3136634 RepID=UPI002C48DD74|nr:KpsF/GutQ family sugar-phosphate isomerase [Alcaligenes sp.]HRL27916.1 KpsF/GutQ family sugar-phosphate isomerase [Alcaligenes sp.]